MLVSFIAKADDVLPISSAYLMIWGLRACIFPNGI